MDTYHVNEAVERSLPRLDELSGVMFLPSLLIVAKVPGEGLLTPRAIRGVANRSPSTDALVHSGVLEEQSQSAVAAHGVARDGNARGIEFLEVLEQHLGQLLGQVGFHEIVFAPGVLLRINVERRSAAKVVGVMFARQVSATRRSVRVHEREAVLGGVRMKETLFGDIVRCASQSRQVHEDRRGFGFSSRTGQEDGQVHGSRRAGRLVRELQEAATSGGNGCVCGKGHDYNYMTVLKREKK